MLIEFSVENFRSFQDQVTLSMEAAKISSRPASLDEHNVFSAGKNVRLLTSAAIYGANASGKSNLIAALRFMRTFVGRSFSDTQVGEPIPVEPFRLNTETERLPSTFEIVFLIADEQYRYGFAANSEQIVREWLFRLGSSRELTLFERHDAQIKVNSRSFREGLGLEKRTRSNALFLSVVAQNNGAIAGDLVRWFGQLGVNLGVTDKRDLIEALHNFERSSDREAIEELVRRLDIGIEAIAIERVPFQPPSTMPAEVSELMQQMFDRLTKNSDKVESVSVKTYHQRYDRDGGSVGTVAFDLEAQESAGTRRAFALAYPIVRALRKGGVLVVDELDARMHPNLAVELIKLFNDPVTNPHHAQLIFTTHNTNLLSAKLFRRDQIWFVEKSRRGASDLYSLVEYRLDERMVRNDASFEKDYIAGRYGAVPFIGDLAGLLEAEHGQE
ncbi:AAA family ATPase [Candidatus Chloroploca sp. M-50]|uniref:AAA family ATPase n=1 Tax=Candidatus Chloroploca mongolica TaxID=2528176 RepID=A0ABS4DE72_9CHLR|nr:ATP-binding protein [Candidatus Chloroploca mongolica]MBP1467750.1 AAA family ATPase [Candidatus Chloroploca mongolica]